MERDELYARKIIDFEKHKFIRDLKNLRFLKVYAVRANSLTGAWLEEPFSTGETVTSETWLSQEDLADVHFSTFVQTVGPEKREVTCALLVNWIKPDHKLT